MLSSFMLLVGGTYLFLNRDALQSQVAFKEDKNIAQFTAEKAQIAEKAVAGAVTNSTAADAASAKHFVASQNRIEIPKLNVIGNITYPGTAAEVDKKIDYSVVHMPQSVNPGEPGNAVLTAHSSNTISNHYSSIFSTLNKLNDGDMILAYKNGNLLVYKVYYKEVIKPRLENIKKTNKEILTLSTCWPIGTANKRLIIYAERVR